MKTFNEVGSLCIDKYPTSWIRLFVNLSYLSYLFLMILFQSLAMFFPLCQRSCWMRKFGWKGLIESLMDFVPELHPSQVTVWIDMRFVARKSSPLFLRAFALHLICCWEVSIKVTWASERTCRFSGFSKKYCWKWCSWNVSLRSRMLLVGLYFDWSSYYCDSIQSIQQYLLFFFENLFLSFTKLCLECFISCLTMKEVNSFTKFSQMRELAAT
jgi:hypothetical protein